jgi:hypothetical protein
MQAKYSGFMCSGILLPVVRGASRRRWPRSAAKTVQVRMGHSTLAMTADRYGHLFPSTDDADRGPAGSR